MIPIPPERASILLVSEPLKPGGIASYAMFLLKGLLNAGLAPRLAAPDATAHVSLAKDVQPHVAIFPGLHGSLSRPFVFRRFAAWAREPRPALIHGLSAFTAPTCQRLAEELDVPFVLSVHHYQVRNGLKLGSHCRRLLACSESIRENLVNDARVPKELVRVVRIGIQIPETGEVRAPDPERQPLVATFAKLTPRKDIATFLHAARHILNVRLGACQFVVVGEGPEEPALRKLSRKLKLEKHVTFSHAGVPHDKILADVDVYVQTSKQEGFGVSVLEAMAASRPVVATSVGGLISLVRDGQTGFLVPVSDPGALATRILDLLSDAPLRQRFGEAGRDWAAKEFALPRMIENTVEIYAQVLGLAPTAPGASGLRAAVKLK